MPFFMELKWQYEALEVKYSKVMLIWFNVTERVLGVFLRGHIIIKIANVKKKTHLDKARKYWRSYF